MSASQFTIYMIESSNDFDETVDYIVETFNTNNNQEDKHFIEKTLQDVTLNKIDAIRVFVRAAKTNPDWGNVLDDIVLDLEPVVNINHSYVCFIQIADYIFVTSGGTGYLLIDNFKKPFFGIDLLSRLMEENDNYIKKVSHLFFSGNIVGGDTHFSGNVSSNDEKDFNNIFKELQLEIPSPIIRNKLDIKIPTIKKDYQLFAKDSIKLSKSLSIRELDRFLYRISRMLDQEPPYALNPYYPVNYKNPIIKELDTLFIKQLIDVISNNETVNDIDIIPHYQTCDKHTMYLLNNKKKGSIYHNKQDMLNFVKKHINKEMEPIDVLNVIKNIKTVGEIENEEIINSNFYKHIDCKLIYQEQTYWLSEGIWYVIEGDYIKTLNQTIIEKITEPYNHSFTLEQIKPWSTGSEGEYNFSHHSSDNIYVLDKILIDKIEICDLFVEAEDHLYFVHVKDGLDGDVRTLSAQIEMAMRIVHAGINHNSKKLREYYQSIHNKIHKENQEETESTMSVSARIFIKRFPNPDSFVKYVQSMKNKITFIFAYRPLASHDFHNPDTISSTAAKISMINLTNLKQQFDFGLKFMKIDREESTIKST